MAEGEANKAFFSDHEISSFRQNEEQNLLNSANTLLPAGYTEFKGTAESHSLQYPQQQHSQLGISEFEAEEKMEQEILNPIEDAVSQVESGLAYMRSEDASKNFALFASLIDEPEEQKIMKLNEFYAQNKVIQGLNCFFMLDNGTTAAAHHPVNFSEDPNFSLDQNFFEEKNKTQDAPPSSVSHLQQRYQYPQCQSSQLLQEKMDGQENAFSNLQKNKTEEDKEFLNDFIEGYLQHEGHNQDQQSQQGGSQHQHQNHENNPSNSRNNFMQQNIFQSDGFPQQYSQVYNNSFSNNQPQTQQQQLSSKQQSDQQAPNPAMHFHMFNLQEASSKVSSKSAMQKSSASFLDKVNFAVDDFLDKADPTEYPALSKGEDFLLRNLRNYLALQFTQQEKTSYFQKILNSSYQIFLHRLKLLIDQKRMDTKTLLPFICRFSIDIAEKLLQFIYKCDDAFTMKIIREHPFPPQDEPANASLNFSGLQNLDNLRKNFRTSNKDNPTSSQAQSLSEVSQSSTSHASGFTFMQDFEIGRGEIHNCLQENVNLKGVHCQVDQGQKDLFPQQGSQDLFQPQQQNYFHLPEEDIEPEEEDCLPFAPQMQQSQQFNGQNDNRRGQRKPWSKQELQILNNLYNEYEQKIPPWKMEELTKKFNRSIQSIQSKVQKMRRSTHHGQHSVSIASIYNLPVIETDLLEGSRKKLFSPTKMNQQNGYQSQFNPFGNLSQNHNQVISQGNGGDQTSKTHGNAMQGGNVGLMKMENKLRACLYELPGYEGTKSQILAKMREKYYTGSNSSSSSQPATAASWEKSASQMLSSASFQKKRGVFTLREEAATPKKEQLDVSGTNRQRLTYVLSLLPSRTGTLLDILSAYQATFPSCLSELADQRKLKDNISKTLNAYDTFDKSLSKTIYFLTQQEILIFDADQRHQDTSGIGGRGNNGNQQMDNSNNNYSNNTKVQ